MRATPALTETWQTHIDAWRVSAHSQAAYCREHGLNKSQFTYWKRKLLPARSGGRRPDGSAFVPVKRVGSAHCGLKITLPCGLVLEGLCEENLPLVLQLTRVWL